MIYKIVVCVLIFCSSSVSYSKTCADVYRSKAKKYYKWAFAGILDLPLEVTTYGIGGACLRDARQRNKVASLLDSATRIRTRISDTNDLNRVQKFYEKYILDRFVTTLTLEVVTEYLDRLNQYGVELKVCKQFGYLIGNTERGREKVANFLFPNGSLITSGSLSDGSFLKVKEQRENLMRQNDEYRQKIQSSNVSNDRKIESREASFLLENGDSRQRVGETQQ